MMHSAISTFSWPWLIVFIRFVGWSGPMITVNLHLAEMITEWVASTVRLLLDVHWFTLLWQSFSFDELFINCYSSFNSYLLFNVFSMQLFVWNQHSTQPVLKYCEHTAAVKAIAWSPHLHGLLASGGGTADRCIRFWNTTLNTHLSCMDTGSQVCSPLMKLATL